MSASERIPETQRRKGEQQLNSRPARIPTSTSEYSGGNCEPEDYSSDEDEDDEDPDSTSATATTDIAKGYMTVNPSYRSDMRSGSVYCPPSRPLNTERDSERATSCDWNPGEEIRRVQSRFAVREEASLRCGQRHKERLPKPRTLHEPGV